MGNRQTILVKDSHEQVALYSHWGGHVLTALQTALTRGRGRWDDMPYLARIIFCDLIKGRERDTTGYGIMARPSGDSTVHIVDCSNQTVTIPRRGQMSFEYYVTTFDAPTDYPEYDYKN